MIIHNLHKRFIHTIQKSRMKIIASSFLIFLSGISNAQDSLVLDSNIKEKQEIDFQKHLFDAMTSKATKNYLKAIESLEECNRLLPNEKAVLFELSKNYYFLNKVPEALDYAQQALALDTENVWLLEHLVAIYKKDRNFEEAIAVQEKIGAKYPKKRQQIVFLHLQNNDKDSAQKLLNELADAKLLNARLRSLKKKMEGIDEPPRIRTKTPTLSGSLEERFQKEKSFPVLNKLLTKLDNENNSELLNYSEQGMSLFPAQPIVYLMNGKALNNNKEFKKAIESLQNGIDFVIDDKNLENRFYSELVKAYKALGDAKNVDKYQKKLK